MTSSNKLCQKMVDGELTRGDDGILRCEDGRKCPNDAVDEFEINGEHQTEEMWLCDEHAPEDTDV